MNNDIFDGFTVNVFLDEDGDYLAHFVELPNISAFSDTPEGALKELAIGWQGVKKSYQKHNEPIPKAPPRAKQTVASSMRLTEILPPQWEYIRYGKTRQHLRTLSSR